MKLYLDNCMFNRPFDNQSNIKILLETEAKLRIQENIRMGTYKLIWSYILDYENDKNPFREKKEQIEKWKSYAFIDIKATDEIIHIANVVNSLGLKKFDSLHIACSIAAGANCFLTTDKSILNKAEFIKEVQVKDPIDFVREVLS